jgi:hypothetical protein
MAPKPTPNGNAAQPPVETTPSNIPAVVGINLGNAYASIAVYTKVRPCWDIRENSTRIRTFPVGRTSGMYRKRKWGAADRLCNSVPWRGNCALFFHCGLGPSGLVSEISIEDTEYR